MVGGTLGLQPSECKDRWEPGWLQHDGKALRSEVTLTHDALVIHVSKTQPSTVEMAFPNSTDLLGSVPKSTQGCGACMPQRGSTHLSHRTQDTESVALAVSMRYT